MREEFISVLTTNKQIKKARVFGKLSLKAVAILDVILYCLKHVSKEADYYLLDNMRHNLLLEQSNDYCIIDKYEYSWIYPEEVDNPYAIETVAPPVVPEEPGSNEPPTIGDVSLTVGSGVTTVLTLEMFTSQACEPYNDPENDDIDAIRIDEIHNCNVGEFRVDGFPIEEGQIIFREQIEAEEFIHVGGDVDDFASDSFSFSLRDEGSMKWVK